MKNIINAFKEIFSNKRYVLISLISAIAVAIVYQLLADIQIITANNGVTFAVITITLNYILALLIGVSISFVWYQIDLRRRFDLKNGGGSTISLFTGLVTSGCPVCGTVITSFLGIGSALAALPLRGLELKFLSFGLLSVMLVISSRQITKGICEKCK